MFSIDLSEEQITNILKKLKDWRVLRAIGGGFYEPREEIIFERPSGS